MHRRIASTRLCSYATLVHRRALLELLAAHRPVDARELEALQATTGFVAANRDCFERSLLAGHVTGSAWVVSDDGGCVVLLHHGKLGRWLQPGGHADGDSDVARVASREAREETSLRSLRIDGRGIFDVDVHEIPARGSEPAHLHYDVRFLFRADRAESPVPSAESYAGRWLRLEEARRLAPGK